MIATKERYIFFIQFIFFALFSTTLYAQTSWVELGSDIDGNPGDGLGSSVSLSADGTILAIGGSGAGSSKGLVRVYALNESTWVQKGATINGEADGDSFGHTVSLSADGTLLAIGAPFSVAGNGEFSNSGRVQVYSWSGTDWVQQGSNLDAEAAQENFGASLSLSKDGDVLVVGAPGSNAGGTSRGSVRVFEWSGTAWVQQGSDIDGINDFDNSGVSVSLDLTGATLAIGANMNGDTDVSAGEVKVYTWNNSGSTWDQKGSDLNGDADSDYFGNVVSLSSDGTRLAVGAPQDFMGGFGYVKIFDFEAGDWTQVGSNITSDLDGDEFGLSIALSGDGSYVIAGARNSVTDNLNGRIEVYTLNVNTWEQVGDDITGEANADTFGASVSISEDGTRMVAGAPINAGGGASSGHVRIYEQGTPDTEAPGVDIEASAGSPTNANPISITITFSEEVTGFEAGDLTVDNGTADNLNTSDNITFTADITPAADGAVTVDIAAATVQDLSGNDNTAATQFAVTYDGTAPAVTITSTESNPTNTTPFQISIEFTETVAGFTIDDLVVDNGTAGNLSTSDNITFTADITPSGDGEVTIDLSAAAAQDLAGNTNGAAGQFSITYDATAPAVLITTEQNPTNASPIAITITFSEEVAGFEAGDLTVVNGTADNLNTSDNITFTADLTPAADGAVTVDIAAATAQDLAENDNTAASQFSIIYDGAAPAVTITSGESNPTNSTPFQVSIAFTEEVTDFTIDDLVVGNGTAGNLATSDDVTFTVDITPTADGAVSVDIAATTAQDLAGNNNTAASQFSITYDGTAPAVTITSGESSPTNTSPFQVSIEFTEEVTGFTIDDVVVANGTAGNLFTTDNIIFTANITPTADGDVGLVIDPDVAQDLAGNNNTFAFPLFITYDVTAPAVTITSEESSPTNTSPFQVSIQFTEEVTGFTIDDLTVTNGTAGNLSTSDDVTFTAAITPTADGVVTVDVAVGAAQDLAGNDNTASTQFSVNYDVTGPSVTITSEESDPTNTSPFQVSIVFTEEVTGFTIDDIVIGNGTAGNLFTTDNMTFTADIDPAADGVVTVDIAAEAAQDQSGNDNAAASQFSITCDGTAPTLEIQGAPVAVNDLTPFTLTFVFSEDVTGFDVSDIAVTNATIGNFQITDADTYTADITPTGDGNITIDVAAGAARDAVGNGNVAAQQTVIFDSEPPTVVIQSDEEVISSLNSFTVTFEFNEAVTGFELADITVTNGTIANLQATDASTYTADITPDAALTNGESITIDIAAGVALDLAGNENVAADQLALAFDSPYSGGSGTAEDPWLIANEADLRYLSATPSDWDEHFRQVANISMGDDPFTPIGRLHQGKTFLFTGNYNGGGFVIDGISIEYVEITGEISLFGDIGWGLFGSASGKIQNLGVTNPSAAGDAPLAVESMGCLVGVVLGDLIIENCFAAGKMPTVTNGIFVGGIVGGVEDGKSHRLVISNCYSDVDISGSIVTVGGLIGYARNMTIRDSYATGSLFAIETVFENDAVTGGLVGLMLDLSAAPSTIINSYSTCPLVGKVSGGLVGEYYLDGEESQMTTVTNSFWDAEATGLTTSAGGTGLTTAEMKDHLTFMNAGWDFECLSADGTDDSWTLDIKNINNGYPILGWQTPDDNCLLVTSTEELAAHTAVYPNPTQGPVTITAEGHSIHRIEVYNVMGDLVLTMADQAACPVKELDLTDQSPGIYFIRAFDGDKTSTHRVILQK